METGKRWSGAEWATEKSDIMMVGCGGINSWTALSLSRIDHTLYIVDPDTIDQTNVQGGQLFRHKDIGRPKALAIVELCRELGCTNSITPVTEYYNEECGMLNICIAGLDNMKARREVFEAWEKFVEENEALGLSKPALFIDGRLTMEMCEVFAIDGKDKEAILKYKTDHLFDDSEANLVSCTTKQSTFGAMGIASLITATLCNWLTNQKYGFDMREVPFYQRMHLPLMQHKHSNQVEQVVEREVVVEKLVEKEVLRGVREDYPGEMQKLRSFHRLVGSLQQEVGKADEVFIPSLQTVN
jgi:hypothetical protein